MCFWGADQSGAVIKWFSNIRQGEGMGQKARGQLNEWHQRSARGDIEAL